MKTIHPTGKVLVATGAYGREATEADWLAGKDFRVVGGPYFSLRDKQTVFADGWEAIHFVNSRGQVLFTAQLWA